MPPRIEHTPRGTELVTDEGQRLHLDFINDRIHYRKSHRGKNELIAKAVGLGKGFHEVWDLTAGLAEDAWFLVQLGAKVTAYERNPFIAQLVIDAWHRAQSEPSTQAWAQRFEVKGADAIQILKQIPMGQGPSVIYLDPMFNSEKKKTALPRKEMQIFRALMGQDTDAVDLLRESLRVARDRVVVKRPIKESDLLPGVQHRFEGSAIRYDLYQPRSFQKKEVAP